MVPVPDFLTAAPEECAPAFDEGEFLESWEPETRGRAKKSASRSGLRNGEADDLTQEGSPRPLAGRAKEGRPAVVNGTSGASRQGSSRVSGGSASASTAAKSGSARSTTSRPNRSPSLEPVCQIEMERRIKGLPSRAASDFRSYLPRWPYPDGDRPGYRRVSAAGRRTSWKAAGVGTGENWLASPHKTRGIARGPRN